jgi:hypothetical protein
MPEPDRYPSMTGPDRYPIMTGWERASDTGHKVRTQVDSEQGLLPSLSTCGTSDMTTGDLDNWTTLWHPTLRGKIGTRQRYDAYVFVR